MNNSEDKILIIGVGGAGRNIVKHIYEEGIDNAKFITFGNCSGEDDCKEVPHYNIIRMNGDTYTDARKPEEWRKYTENVEDGIREIINHHFEKDIK